MLRCSSLLFQSNKLAIRHIKTVVADLKRGDHIFHKDKLVTVDAVSSVQKGRGARSFMVTCRELSVVGPGAPTPSVINIKPTSKDNFDVLELKDQPATFLYNQGQQLFLMDDTNMEEITVNNSFLTNALLALLEAGEKLRVKKLTDNGTVVAVYPNNTTKCTVTSIIPQGNSVVAVTMSGGRVTCPSIVTVGDRITVDTSTGQYLSRLLSQ